MQSYRVMMTHVHRQHEYTLTSNCTSLSHTTDPVSDPVLAEWFPVQFISGFRSPTLYLSPWSPESSWQVQQFHCRAEEREDQVRHQHAGTWSLSSPLGGQASKWAGQRPPVNCAEKDGVISIQQVGQIVAGKQHSGNPPANPRHQMVNDAIEEMGSSHAALVKTTADWRSSQSSQSLCRWRRHRSVCLVTPPPPSTSPLSWICTASHIVTYCNTTAQFL